MKTRNQIILIALACSSLQANEVTWDGGSGGSWDWSVATNWVGDVSLEGYNYSIIHFAGDGSPTGGNTWNNFSNYTTFNQIIFDAGAASFAVQGNPPHLVANGSIRSAITNNSTNNQELRFWRLSLKDTTINAAAGNLFFNPRGEEFNNDYVYIDPTAIGGGDDLRVTGAAGRIVSFNGIIADGGGATGRIVQEGANILKLGRNNSFSGGVVITDGVVEAQANGALGSGTAVVQANGRLSLQQSVSISNNLTLAGGTLGFHYNDGGAGNYAGAVEVTAASTINMANYYDSGEANGSISGAISGSGAITKSGTGTLSLSGANTYTGATAISAGKLIVQSTIGSSAVTVSGSGAILASDAVATIGSTLTVNAGGILAVGDAANVATATATVVGASTFNNGSIFSWDINGTGTAQDKLITTEVLGDVTPGDAVFRIVVGDSTFADTYWDTNQSWANVFTTDGSAAVSNWASIFGSTVSVVDSSFTPLVTSAHGAFTIDGNSVHWTAVPEPTTALAGLLLTAGLLRRRRA